MNTKVKVFTTILLVLVFGFVGRLYGEEYLNLGGNAREIFLVGSSGIYLDTSSGLLLNPAVPSLSKQLRATYSIGGFGSQGLLNTFGVSLPTSRGVISGLFTVTPIVNNYFGFLLNFSKDITENFLLGFSLKGGAGIDWNINFDLGCIWLNALDKSEGFGLKQVNWGLSLLNLGKPLILGNEIWPSIPVIRADAQISFLNTKFVKANLFGALNLGIYTPNIYGSLGTSVDIADHIIVSGGGVVGNKYYGFGAGATFYYILQRFYGIERMDIRLNVGMENLYYWDNRSDLGIFVGLDFAFGVIDQIPPTIEYKQNYLYVSPNFDGRNDMLEIYPQIEDNGLLKGWKLYILDSKSNVVNVFEGVERLEEALSLKLILKRLFAKKEPVRVPEKIVWDCRDTNGKPVSDGIYYYYFEAFDAEHNKAISKAGTFIVDTTPPSAEISAEYTIFSPNGDGVKDTLPIHQKLSVGDKWVAMIIDQNNKVVRTWDWGTNKAPEKVEWDGLDDNGKLVNDGVYSYKVVGEDLAGNITEKVLQGIILSTKEKNVYLQVSQTEFSPNGDGYFDTIKIKLSVDDTNYLSKWWVHIKDANGNVVREFSGDSKNIKWEIEWDGKDNEGKVVADGVYKLTYTVEYETGDKPTSPEVVVVVDNTPPTMNVSFDPLPFSPDDDGENDLLNIYVKVEDNLKVDNWGILVYTPITNRVFKKFEGRGDIDSKIIWNGIGDDGSLVDSAEDYPVKIFAVDKLSNKVEKFIQPIQVDVLVERTPYGLRIRISSIEFEFGKYGLQKDSEKILKRVAEILRKYPQYKVEIHGHTDNVGTEEYNMKLSLKRAETVRDYLVSKEKLPMERFEVKGFGFSRPIASNDTEEGRRKNRRVEFILMKE